MANFKEVSRTPNRELKTNQSIRQGATARARGLDTGQLKKLVAKRYSQLQENNSAGTRSRLIGLRRALSKRLLTQGSGASRGFESMGHADRRQALKKKLGSDFGDLYSTRSNKGGLRPPTRRP